MGDIADMNDCARLMRSKEGQQHLEEIRQMLEGHTIRRVAFTNNTHGIATELVLDDGEIFVIFQSSLSVEAIREQFEDVLEREYYRDFPERKPTTMKKQTYDVGVREVHVRHYQVDADSEEEAKHLVRQRGPGVTDLDFQEYSHELDSETWSADVQGEHDTARQGDNDQGPQPQEQSLHEARKDVPETERGATGNSTPVSVAQFLQTQAAWNSLREIREQLVGQEICDVSFSTGTRGVQSHLHLRNGGRYSFHETELSLATLQEQFPEVFERLERSTLDDANAPLSTRTINLNLAGQVIQAVAAIEGYGTDAYDSTLDHDGFVAAILGALRTWGDEHALVWKDLLREAEAHFTLELVEHLEDPASESKAKAAHDV